MPCLMESDTTRKLPADAQGSVAIGGREGGIVTKGAAPGGKGAVAVWAAEAGIDGKFAHTAAEDALEVF